MIFDNGWLKWRYIKKFPKHYNKLFSISDYMLFNKDTSFKSYDALYLMG